MDQIRLDRYVVDTLMPDLVGHDKRPSALLVYLYLWSQSVEPRSRKTTASLRDIADGTGLSKRDVREAHDRDSDEHEQSAGELPRSDSLAEEWPRDQRGQRRLSQ